MAGSRDHRRISPDEREILQFVSDYTRQPAFCKTTLEAELTLTSRQAKPVGEENEFVSTEDRPTLQL